MQWNPANLPTQEVCLHISGKVSGSAVDTVGSGQTQIWPVPSFTCFQSPKWPQSPQPLANVRDLVHYSQIFFLFFGDTAFRCSVLVYLHGLFVGCPPESILHSDKRGLKQSLSRAYLFSQVREEESIWQTQFLYAGSSCGGIGLWEIDAYKYGLVLSWG